MWQIQDWSKWQTARFFFTKSFSWSYQLDNIPSENFHQLSHPPFFMTLFYQTKTTPVQSNLHAINLLYPPTLLSSFFHSWDANHRWTNRPLTMSRGFLQSLLWSHTIQACTVFQKIFFFWNFTWIPDFVYRNVWGVYSKAFNRSWHYLSLNTKSKI